MYGKIKEHLEHELAEIKAAGLYKNERIIESPQRAEITVGGRQVLNFCANNYLGLSDNPRLIEAAKKAMDARGYGMSSVRFICGCQDMHKQLEKAIADYFGTEDTILYAACFDANGGVFEPLFTEQDAIISDSLNHASIIDGVRLCKAVRYRYANADMAELEDCLKKAQAQRFRIIVTDGVFSMDGNAAPLDEICRLARQYDALVMVDECHSAGVLGATGRGITELYDLRGEVDILAQLEIHEFAHAPDADGQRQQDGNERVRIEAFGIFQRAVRAQKHALHRAHEVKVRDIDRAAGLFKPQSQLFRHRTCPLPS